MSAEFADYLEAQYGEEVASRYRRLVESEEYQSAKGGYAKYNKNYSKPNFYQTHDRKRK